MKIYGKCGTFWCFLISSGLCNIKRTLLNVTKFSICKMDFVFGWNMLDLKVHPNQRQSLEFCVGQHHNILHIARGRLDVKYFLKILSIFFLLKIEYQLLCALHSENEWNLLHFYWLLDLTNIGKNFKRNFRKCIFHIEYI